MSAMSNQLPFDVPAQPDERYRVRQIPGLRLWLVWDTVTNAPAVDDYFVGIDTKAQALAAKLNSQ